MSFSRESADSRSLAPQPWHDGFKGGFAAPLNRRASESDTLDPNPPNSEARTVNLLLTAGPTYEPIDAVRFIGNRSSGKLGLALAGAAIEADHAVTLLLGPVGEATVPEGATVHRFETTEQLQALLSEHFPRCDALIMAAAVADFRPIAQEAGKLPRGEGQTLELESTPDLVAELAESKRSDQRLIAFALETPDELEERAADKLERKGVDAIVANALQTMGSDRVVMHWHAIPGERHTTDPMLKPDAARWLIKRIEGLFA